MTPTITCDHCESEIDVANDKNCVVYDPSGITAVICDGCRTSAFEHWRDSVVKEWPKQRHAHKIKRGWRA